MTRWDLAIRRRERGIISLRSEKRAAKTKNRTQCRMIQDHTNSSISFI